MNAGAEAVRAPLAGAELGRSPWGSAQAVWVEQSRAAEAVSVAPHGDDGHTGEPSSDLGKTAGRQRGKAAALFTAVSSPRLRPGSQRARRRFHARRQGQARAGRPPWALAVGSGAQEALGGMPWAPHHGSRAPGGPDHHQSAEGPQPDRAATRHLRFQHRDAVNFGHPSLSLPLASVWEP